jgi:quercetin 2,3-dioxygenase
MSKDSIVSLKPLSFMWPVNNPFIFCAHHQDHYPPGNEKMEPKASLSGRQIGQDFDPDLSWRMYHGNKIPGFPAHPHRGFETVTIVTKGMVDHADSHGQAGRYGGGDVQWMTAGSGLQHSEMFPLLKTDQDNPLELFQVWLNLPAAKKMVEPHFKMLWAEDIPQHQIADKDGKKTTITLIAGEWGGIKALDPAPDSWAADPENEVAIWNMHFEQGAYCLIPQASEQANRCLYFYRGSSIMLNGVEVEAGQAIEVKSDEPLEVLSGQGENFVVLLQGRPIHEPLVQHGPFVMNTQAEIREAFSDYQKDGFGGWPWPRHDQAHPKEKGRFARHSDGLEEVK